MPAISAKNARITANGVNLLATKWTLSFKTDELDATSFESGGYANFNFGIHEADLSADAFYNSGSSPFDNPPHIVIGAEIPVILYVDSTGADTTNFSFTKVLVTQCSIDSSVRDLIRYTFSGKIRGTFTPSSTAAITALS